VISSNPVRAVIMLFAVIVAVCMASATHAQQAVNKCRIGGKTVYQSQPCAVGAPAKTVDTSGKSNAQLGKDFSQQAAKDKAKLTEIEKAKQAKEAQARGDELGMSPQQPKMRNLALERIEKALQGKNPNKP
jgi:hypothetical protein